MSAWTQKQTGQTISQHTTTDGYYIYWRADTENIYRYNAITNTVTQIANSGSWPTGSAISEQGPANLCWFKGTLYVSIYDAVASLPAIWKWSGSGTSWSQAYQHGSDIGAEGLLSDSNVMVALFGGNPLDSVYTADGSSWNVATIDGLTSPIVGSAYYIGNSYDRGIFAEFRDYPGTNFYEYEFQAGTGTWAAVYGPHASSTGFFVYSPDYEWFNVGGTYKYTDGFPVSLATPADTSVIPARTSNMPYSTGYRISGTNVIIYFITGGQWDAGETIAVGSAVTQLGSAVRLDSGSVVLLFMAASDGQVWLRDDPIIIASPKDNTFQSFDVEAGGNYLYIGVLDSSDQPQVLRMPTALNANADIAYDPGAGTRVELQCGRYDEHLVWAIGDFGTQKVVRYSPTNYWYWYSESTSDAWAAPARGLFVGPSDDWSVMFSVDEYLQMKQSYWLADSGPYWLTTNPEVPLPFEVNAITRLDVAPEEVMIGAGVDGDPYWYPYWTTVNYSPASGFEFTDVSGSLSDDVGAVTSIIYGIN